MKVTRFDPSEDLIFVAGRVWGPARGQARSLRLVVDTGASETIIIPEILDELGYSPRDAEGITSLRSAIGREEGYLTRVSAFSALCHSSNDFRIHAHDLPEGLNYEIRSREGRILVERIT